MFDADEVSRDVLALGSTVFYVLVVLRTLVGPFPTFTSRLVLAAIVMVLAAQLVEFDGHVARGMAAGFFLGLYYRNAFFNIFASLTWLSLVYAAYRLGSEKAVIGKGVAVGAISIAAGFYLTTLLPL